MNSKKFKLASAAVGASAILAMGALGVAMSPEPETTGTLSEAAEMTLGDTSKKEVPTEVPTPLAEPEVEVELPEGYGP